MTLNQARKAEKLSQLKYRLSVYQQRKNKLTFACEQFRDKSTLSITIARQEVFRSKFLEGSKRITQLTEKIDKLRAKIKSLESQ